jgi:hypothetical protein
VVRAGRRAGRELADDRAALEDGRPQRGVIARVVLVQAAAEDGHRPAAHRRAAVRRRVDTAGETARDHHARRREVAGERRSDVAAGQRRLARPHERDHRLA